MTQEERLRQAWEMMDAPIDLVTLYRLGLEAGRITASDPQQLLESARHFDQAFKQLRQDAFARVALAGESPRDAALWFAQQLEDLGTEFILEGARLGERYEGKSLSEALAEAAEQLCDCDGELAREFGIDPEKVRQIAEKAKEEMKRLAQKVREIEQGGESL
ncbi:MAG: hypothetical protein QXS96_07535 [Candidatus Caldarchaeum sp.]